MRPTGHEAPPDEATGTEASGDPAEESFLQNAARAPAGEPPARMIGQTLGRYRVVSLLGRGGMGVVYYAQDLKLRRPVALKVLPPALVADPERRSRFLREARSAAAVTHPGVAAVYDVGEDAGNVFLAMEYVQGQTLRALLKSRGGGPSGELPSNQVARIGYEIAVALGKAHGVGVIHRDLKPENVMLSEDGIVKILDFGLAKLREVELSAVSETATAAGHLTEAGRVMGTPRYMSPEQALGHAVDPRTDVFSLGVMLYEPCSGQLPYRGVTDMEELVARTRDDPKPLQEIRPDVSADLARVIDRCLQRDFRARYASAADVAEELRPIAASTLGALMALAGGSRTTIPPAALPSAPPARRRWRWLAAAALLLGGAAAFAMLGRRAEPTGSPLAPEDAKIACPILETEDTSQGWLGAAVAHLACSRAVSLLGRRWESALTPAALLDLPRQPVDRFPEDPFAEKNARERSLAAARARGAAYLDGRVVRGDKGFEVDLVLKAGDRALGRGHGTGEAFWQAVRAAMDPLVGPKAIPRAARLDPHQAKWLGFSEVELDLAMEDAGAAFQSGVGIREERDRLQARRAELGVWWAIMDYSFALTYGIGDPTRHSAPDIDRSSPQALARTARAHLFMGGKTPAGDLADEMEDLREKMSDPLDRRNARWVEAEFRLRAGQNDRARDLVLAGLSEEPRVGWYVLMGATHSRTGQVSVARARAAWEPSHPDGWNMLSFTREGIDPQTKLEYMRRAHAVAAGLSLYASQLGRMLVLAGEREEARALAARLVSGEERMHLVGEGLAIDVEASEGRFAAALAKAEDRLFSVRDFGRYDRGEVMIGGSAVELAMVLGRQAEFADAFATKLILAEPPRILPTPIAAEHAVLACALASPATARPCFARLRKLVDAEYFQGSFERTAPFLAGAERYAQGDFKGAAAAWRALAAEPPSGRTWLILGDGFDRAGEPDIAERLDERGPYMGMLRGLSIAHPRMARRAAARGDVAAARDLAQKIVDAWSVADTPVPAVQEMRALLARLR